jgi:hypothetical protein
MIRNTEDKIRTSGIGGLWLEPSNHSETSTVFEISAIIKMPKFNCSKMINPYTFTLNAVISSCWPRGQQVDSNLLISYQNFYRILQKGHETTILNCCLYNIYVYNIWNKKLQDEDNRNLQSSNSQKLGRKWSWIMTQQFPKQQRWFWDSNY